MAIGLFVVISFFSINYILTTEYGEKLLARSSQIESDAKQYSSGFERIYRGYYVWEELTPVEKWIGINSNSKVKEKIKKMCSGCNIWRGGYLYECCSNFFDLHGIYRNCIILLAAYFVVERK